MLLWDSELSPEARALLDDDRVVVRLARALGVPPADVVAWRDGAALDESRTAVACRWLEDRARRRRDTVARGVQALEDLESGAR